MDGIVEEIEFLARSPNRVRLLKTLNENDRLQKRELKTTFEGARTTLTRNLEVLENHGFIRKDGLEYAITPAGQAVITEFLEFVETMDVTAEYTAFFRWLTADTFDLDPRALADADLVLAEPSAPYAMIDRHVERLSTMEHCRATLPITGLHAGEVACDRILEHGATAELVVTPDVADVHRHNSQYAELIDDMIATGRVEYYVYDGVIPFGLAIIDNIVQLIASEGDEPRALIETTANTVYAWAEDTIAHYKHRATPLLANQ